MSMFGDWFSEDEDDIFMGSPKSKFFDVSREASKEVVEDEIDKIIEKLAVLEMIAKVRAISFLTSSISVLNAVSPELSTRNCMEA